MPQLTVRGIPLDTMKKASAPLCRELAGICGCPEDYFTIDCLAVTSLFGGMETATFPFIEVAWFDRGSEVRDRVAEAISRHICDAGGISEVEVAFKVYHEQHYYINGKPCG